MVFRSIVVRRSLMVIPFVLYGVGDGVLAQQTTTPQQNNLATITADTGALAFRPSTTIRYPLPGLCREAALTKNYILSRGVATRLAMTEVQRTDPTHDTLPGGTVSVARACGDRFTIANTAARDLPDLLDVALLAQNDTLALAVLTREAQAMPNVSDRAKFWNDAVTKLLASHPPRVAMTTTVLATLDALGPSVMKERLAAHGQLLSFSEHVLDEPRIRDEANHIIELTRTLNGSALGDANGSLMSAYQALMKLAFFNAPDSMASLAQRAQGDLSRVPPPPNQKNMYVGASNDAVIRALWPLGSSEQFGRPTPQLHADFWFPAKPSQRDTIQPIPGVVTLFISVDSVCYSDEQAIFLYDFCPQYWATLRRWQTQYGANGLAMTLVAGTSGSSLLSGPQTPAEEATNLDWYIHQYLHLPMTLGVQTIPFGPPLPAPDGRFLTAEGKSNKGAFPFDSVYRVGGAGINVVLTGKDGNEMYAGVVSPTFEALLKRVINGPPIVTPLPPPAPASTRGAAAPTPSTGERMAPKGGDS